MIRRTLVAACAFLVVGMAAQTSSPRPKFDTFEVATIKPVESDGKRGRYMTMQGKDRFVVRDYTLQSLIAAAYGLNSQAVSGGPAWVGSDHFDILAATPGDGLPSYGEQMSMLRALLAERFKLVFHRQTRDFSIYVLEPAKAGSKLRASTAPADRPASMIGVVSPRHVLMPGRNATMEEFASLLQRAILDRPVIDKTGLAGRYDFDLTWSPDESQFDGSLKAPADADSPPLFTAVQEQLGLRLVATRGPVETLVVDGVERPSEN